MVGCPLKRWEKTSPSSVAMGHEVGVRPRPASFAQACLVIANGGFLVRPRPLTRTIRSFQRPRSRPWERRLHINHGLRKMEGVVIKPTERPTKYGAHSFSLPPFSPPAIRPGPAKQGHAQILKRNFRAHQYNSITTTHLQWDLPPCDHPPS